MVQLYAVVESYLATLQDRRDEGQGLVEYALIIAIVAILIVGALGTFRGQIENVFTRIGTALNGT